MNFVKKTVFAAALILGGATLVSAMSEDPAVEKRQASMEAMGANMKVLGGMAGGKIPYDMKKAQLAKETIVKESGMIAKNFKKNVITGKSEAKENIWSNWSDFEQKASELGIAANMLNVSSAAMIQGSLAKVGGACKACHSEYRVKK